VTPTASLLVIGGSPECQRQFIKYVARGSTFGNSYDGKINEEVEIANNFLLGYTYVQFRDDNEEDVSSLNVYTIQQLSPEDEATAETYEMLIHHVAVTSSRQNHELLVTLLFDWNDHVISWLENAAAFCSAIRNATADLDGTQKAIDTIRVRLKNYTARTSENGFIAETYSDPADAPLDKWVYETPLGVNLLISLADFSSNPQPIDELNEVVQQFIRCVALKRE
jgi:hypothetical protein